MAAPEAVAHPSPEASPAPSVTSAAPLPGGLGIQPVKRHKLHEQVADALRALITEARLRPGDALPAERDLARQFGVSRVTIREALGRLQLWGLVETRHGGGHYVGDLSLEHVVGPLSAAIQHNRQLRAELLEARAIFEPAICRVAAQRRSDGDVSKLEAIVRRQAERVERGELAVEEDSAFHLALAEATGNRIVVHVTQTINELLLESRQRSLRTPDRPRRSLAGHLRIVAAVRARDGEAARQAMLDHIEEIGQALRAADQRAV